MSGPEPIRCLLNGCNRRALPDSGYCGLLHSSDAVKRGEADACVHCKRFAKTPGFPTCSKPCGTLLALSRQSSGTTGYQSRSYSATSYPPSATTGPKVPKKDHNGKYNWEYPCGCTIATHVATPPATCPICRASASTGRVQQDSLPSSVPGSAPHRNADPFQDSAESALARVDPRHQTAGGFRPNRPRVKNDPTPKDMDPLAVSDDEAGYATPSEVALPESPVVETTSGSDSAVLVDYSEGRRSNTMMTAPPAYEDMDWTNVDPPSGRSSPAKDPTLPSSVTQKKVPELPPRNRGLAVQTMTSSRSPGVSANAGQAESASSPSAWNKGAPEQKIARSGTLGRPQNSKHSALSPSTQPDASSVPLFPSAPTNALGISETGDTPKNPLVIADPKAGDQPDGLSNQDPFPIEYKKKKYPSGEHLFHAMKFMETRPLLAEHIRECDDPKGEADRFYFEQNPGWDQMQLQKMEEVIQLKCKQHGKFKDELRNTGDTHIWFNDSDPFWGTGTDGKGENKFGEVLMRVRDSLPAKGRLTRK